MKYLLLILVHFTCTLAEAQFVDSAALRKAYIDRISQSTYRSGDLIWLTSSDTNKIKVEKGKIDTIGPQLCLVSDTSHDHWNGVSAMWVYEVRIYTTPYYAQGWLPKHFCWLDSKKKPFNLKVWQAN